MFQRIRDAFGGLTDRFSTDDGSAQGGTYSLNTGSGVAIDTSSTDQFNVTYDNGYTFTARLRPGTELVEHSALMDEPRHWVIENVAYGTDHDVIGYRLRQKDGNHTECYDSDTLRELIYDGTFEVSQQGSYSLNMNGTSTDSSVYWDNFSAQYKG